MQRVPPIVLIALLLFWALPSFAQNGISPPNVVIITLADDLGYGDVQSFNPNSKILTQNLDN